MILAAFEVKNGTMTLGDFVLVNTFLLQLYTPLNLVANTYRITKTALVRSLILSTFFLFLCICLFCFVCTEMCHWNVFSVGSSVGRFGKHVLFIARTNRCTNSLHLDII